MLGFISPNHVRGFYKREFFGLGMYCDSACLSIWLLVVRYMSSNLSRNYERRACKYLAQASTTCMNTKDRPGVQVEYLLPGTKKHVLSRGPVPSVEGASHQGQISIYVDVLCYLAETKCLVYNLGMLTARANKKPFYISPGLLWI